MKIKEIIKQIKEAKKGYDESKTTKRQAFWGEYVKLCTEHMDYIVSYLDKASDPNFYIDEKGKLTYKSSNLNVELDKNVDGPVPTEKPLGLIPLKIRKVTEGKKIKNDDKENRIEWKGKYKK